MKKVINILAFIVLVLLIGIFPVYAENSGVEQSQVIQINKTNFPDENFRSYVKDEVAKGGDVLTPEMIERTNTIFVIDRLVKNLDGILYFKNLENLFCSNNYLTELDVKGLIHLKNLSCYDNYLEVLDLTENSELENLLCWNNRIISIHLKENSSLKQITCNLNQIETLDLDEAVNLEKIYCSENRLTRLNVNELKKLTQLYCSNNQLSSLDVKNNENLTELDCSSNQLNELDLRGATYLRSLACYNNCLAKLNIEKNTYLNSSTSYTSGQTASALKVVENTNGFEMDLKALHLMEEDFEKITMTGGGVLNKKTGIVTFIDRPYAVYYEYDTGNKGLEMRVDIPIKSVSEIVLVQMPAKTVYAFGEDLDLAGLKIEALYNDGSRVIVDENLQVMGYSSEIAGEQTLTVVYEGEKVQFMVEVLEPEYPLGDINADHFINASDALLALRCSVKEIALEEKPLKRADVTKDEQVNASDALEILRYAVKEIDSFE
ncbi:MAG: hypothetical protein EUB_01658 [Eubacterium sp.]|uniref:bacterial Ig-like domain-containing protein n=1 Tax=Eubacterium sp. TaxID=142586 RepID=UPI00302B4C98